MANWIEVDGHLNRYLSEKKRLNSTIPHKVFVAETGTEEAQNEVLGLLVDYLTRNHPQAYSRHADEVQISGENHPVNLKDGSVPGLLKAAMLVQEDLVLMRKGKAGWRLAAASVCFPSSWVLAEKFSKPMHEIHAPVPDFGEGTRNATLIERIFDNLQTEHPAERFNWSVYTDAELFHDSRAGERFVQNNTDQAFLRVEHQTLTKLPVSGDILFTIRIHVDPLEILAKRKDCKEIVEGFVGTLKAMTLPQLEYKGLEAERDLLITKLTKMAGAVDGGAS